MLTELDVNIPNDQLLNKYSASMASLSFGNPSDNQSLLCLPQGRSMLRSQQVEMMYYGYTALFMRWPTVLFGTIVSTCIRLLLKRIAQLPAPWHLSQHLQSLQNTLAYISITLDDLCVITFCLSNTFPARAKR